MSRRLRPNRLSPLRLPGRFVVVAAVLAALSLAACGGGDDQGGSASSPTPGAPPGESSGKLGEDALLAVNDEFVTCVQQEDVLGLVVHYRDGKAVSSTEGIGGAEYNDKLSAPKTIGTLVDAGKAQYVGLRANTREGSEAADLDILIFPSESEAAAEAGQLAKEAESEPDQKGLFVTVPVGAKPGRKAASALAACIDGALP